MSIVIRNLNKNFGAFAAVDGVSFTVNRGEFVSLLGPSGSGKSTVLRCIAGLEIPDSGSIEIDRENVTRLSVQDRHVGFVFQHYALFKHMSVFDNVAFGLKVRGVGAAAQKRMVKELLELVGLTGYGSHHPGELSGGQRQRVALARALAPEPKLLLLDEPFGALDARLRKGLRSWLKSLHDRIRLTTLLVTHDQEEAFELSDRVVVLNGGRIEQDGDPKSIFNEPATSFVAGFVGETNSVHGPVADGAVSWGPFQFPAPETVTGHSSASVVFRPIDVRVSSTQEGRAFPGTIRTMKFLGSLEELTIGIGEDKTVIAHVPKDSVIRSDFRPGGNVYVDIASARVFPIGNGVH